MTDQSPPDDPLLSRPGFDVWQAVEEAATAEALERGLQWPRSKALAALSLTSIRRDIEAQTPHAGTWVMFAVAQCAKEGLVMPPWLACEFIRRYEEVTRAHVRSWDDCRAFGQFWPPKVKLENQRRTSEALVLVMQLIEDFTSRCPEQPLQALWDEFDRDPKNEASTLPDEVCAQVRALGFGSTKACEVYGMLLGAGLFSPRR